MTKAIIIIDGRKNQVVQLNQHAEVQGIKAGMGLGTAISLCEHLQVLSYDAELERQSMTQIATVLYNVSADLCIDSCKGVALKVDTMLAIYPSVAAFWQAADDVLKPLTLSYRYANACSIKMAKLLAQQGINRVDISQAQTSKRLYSIALANTELDSKAIEQLRRAGIKTVGQLQHLSISELSKRFDSEVVHYIGCLFGKFHETAKFYQPTETFELTVPLLYEAELLAWIDALLMNMLLKLEAFLRCRNKLASTLHFYFLLRDAEAVELEVSSAEPQYQAQYWKRLLDLKLAPITLLAPVQEVRLKVDKLLTQEVTTPDLFTRQQTAMSELALLSLLRAKLGHGSVCFPSLTGDPRPEYATRYHDRRCDKQLPLSPKFRPSMLLPEPQPLTEKVQHVSGPERIATGWWDGHTIQRDYFIVRNQQQQLLWVFRDSQQRWFLHGVFC
ncbi:Y-family DNA polymerase [Pseudoalteromonas sp. T1lg65]|uniref:Y-family DNA polymerase n=1 Tax=Pseudoalteromonas sp. T1lg65 TaxID=2077101 RepID=UPI003F7B08B0